MVESMLSMFFAVAILYGIKAIVDYNRSNKDTEDEEDKNEDENK